MTAVYPTSLPTPMTFGLQPTSQLASSADTDIGPIDNRRITQQSTATATITFKYLNDQYKVFVAWWKTDLLYGRTWFIIDLPSAQGYDPHYARFISRYKASKRGYRHMEVTCELEIRERQIESLLVI